MENLDVRVNAMSWRLEVFIGCLRLIGAAPSMRCCVAGVFAGLTLLSADAARAQSRALPAADFDNNILDIARPRIAVASDGSFALAFEALVQREAGGQPETQIVVRRFSQAAHPLDPVHFFEGKSCSQASIWLFDAMEHAEIAFRPDGVLLVLMHHTGELQLGQGQGINAGEANLAAIDASGRLMDLNASGNCEVMELVFQNGRRQDRPRLATSPSAQAFIAVDGFFSGANLRNSAIRILDAQLNELVAQAIHHDDPASQQAHHLFPDVATNGVLTLTTWMRCPAVDAQGNVNDCDVEAQFTRADGNGQFQAVGENVKASSGDADGTLNLYPAAAMNEAGQSVIVWADGRTGSSGDVFGQRFDGEGQPVGENFQISGGDGSVDSRPEVAMMADGSFMVVWIEGAAEELQARGRRFDAAATPLEAPFLLSPEASYITAFPHVVSDGSRYHYTWAGLPGGEPTVFLSSAGTIVAVDPVVPGARKTDVLESFPNPFLEAVTIRYRLPANGWASLALYDLLGREVARLVDAPRHRGDHQIRFDAAGLAPGVYLVRLRQGTHRRSRLLTRTE